MGYSPHIPKHFAVNPSERPSTAAKAGLTTATPWIPRELISGESLNNSPDFEAEDIQARKQYASRKPALPVLAAPGFGPFSGWLRVGGGRRGGAAGPEEVDWDAGEHDQQARPGGLRLVEQEHQGNGAGDDDVERRNNRVAKSAIRALGVGPSAAED